MMEYYGPREEKTRRSGNVDGGSSLRFQTIYLAESQAAE
jgi:hypothetical protein